VNKRVLDVLAENPFERQVPVGKRQDSIMQISHFRPIASAQILPEDWANNITLPNFICQG
jgi:hypothetical protein